VLWQKVNDANPRGDCITKVDFAGKLDDFVHNWSNVNDKNNKLLAHAYNPPWGWDDMDDRHKCGEPAINPAKIIRDYFTGLREFSLEYIHNPYLNIFKE